MSARSSSSLSPRWRSTASTFPRMRDLSEARSGSARGSAVALAPAAARIIGHHRGVLVLAVKALLAPAFVVGASLTARRFGARLGGVVGGLPVVAGPILLVYALVPGRGV